MKKFTKILEVKAAFSESLTLPFELRQKSRLRVELDSGEEVAVILPRGRILRHGDQLISEAGVVVEIRAAHQRVTTVFADSYYDLVRAAYHLGNRHVALQIGTEWIRYEHDHVLDQMVMALGLRIAVEDAPFEPEPGAYSGEGHSHSHGHSDGEHHSHTHKAHEHKRHDHEHGKVSAGGKSA
ncbi:MAG: urease accessory protein UreE [Deltaproteobacteria bacterium]|jgi:urease accessory protein|nr:urease accessory protein UreE [Deltaproteobacteria bacterium]MBT6435319.1 urease accessory protein UreE [Deltaproteobacteria bacterium]MBT6488166.1 urease accessory protein UreE [Deltaproteobacteria bacterium]